MTWVLGGDKTGTDFLGVYVEVRKGVLSGTDESLPAVPASVWTVWDASYAGHFLYGLSTPLYGVSTAEVALGPTRL